MGIVSIGLGVGVAIGLVNQADASAWWWLLVVLPILAGAFALFESYHGWCAVRAMGFRTPI